MSDCHFTFKAIGTDWIIDITDIPENLDQSKLLVTIKQRIKDFDETYSRFLKGSLIIKMSQKSGRFTLPDDAKPLMDIYYQLYQLTDGAFTPLIGQVLVDAGYDAHYSLQPKKLVHPPKWEDVIDYKHPTLYLKQPVLLDFGAAGKGYLIDIIGSLLHQHNLDSFCIDAGGDILQSSADNTSLKVGLENPDNAKQVIGVVEITNKSISASAGNRRKWHDFHHIIDPFSLKSPIDVMATWVIASSTIVSDALATCLFFTSAKILAKDYNFEYLMMYQNTTIEMSENFNAELYIS